MVGEGKEVMQIKGLPQLFKGINKGLFHRKQKKTEITPVPWRRRTFKKGQRHLIREAKIGFFKQA